MRPPSGNVLTLFATGIAAVAAADRRLQPRVQFGRAALRQLVIASKSGYQAMNGFGRKPSPVCSR